MTPQTTSSNKPRCHYFAPLDIFLHTDNDTVFGRVVKMHHGADQTTTNEAWECEIAILKAALSPWEKEDAYIIFEYDIPRLGKRIDVVVLLKVGSSGTGIAAGWARDQLLTFKRKN